MKITKSQLKRIIEEEMNAHNSEGAIAENLENINIENIQIAIQVIGQLAATIGIPIAMSGVVISKLKKYIASKDQE